MSTSDGTVSKDDFAQADWKSVIAAVTIKSCDSYSGHFFEASPLAATDSTKTIFRLLGMASSMRLDLDDKMHPLKQRFVLGGFRGSIPDDFTETDLTFFLEIVSDVDDPDLRARISDILWLRRVKNGYQQALIAVDSYLESASKLDDADKPLLMILRLERALQLASSLSVRSTEKILNQFLLSVQKWIATPELNDIPIRLMRVLQKMEAGDATVYAVLSEAEAVRAEAALSWELAGDFWRVKADWELILRNEDGYNAATIRAAETLVNRAEQATTTAEGCMAAAEFIREAIQELRKVPNTRERVEDLKPILLGYEKIGVKAVKTISTPVEIEKFREEARGRVRGQTFIDAIQSLACLTMSANVAELRAQVEELANNSIMALMPWSRVNDEGKRLGWAPALASEIPTEREIAIRSTMLTNAMQIQDIKAAALISPAIQQIVLEHNIREEDLRPIVWNNVFVPAGREGIYTKGLYAGLAGDYLVSSHLLLPQLENSLRRMLYELEAIPSSMSATGIQDEHSLNVVLEHPKLTELLGEDIVFDLQGLLVERFGTNFRNNVAHGLYDDGSFLSTRAIYCFWLVLHLCCGIRLHTMQPNPDGQAA